jgi:curved DNA-binding protein CbpA
MITHYDVLKVSPNASLVVILAAYDALCKKYNPDNYQDETKRMKAQAVIKRLNAAYAVLSDVEKRKLYDESMEIFDAKSKVK